MYPNVVTTTPRSFNRTPKNKDDLIAKEMNKIRNEFLANETNTRRSKAIETNEKMKKVMDAWLGNTTETIFREYKKVVEGIKLERDKLMNIREKEHERLKQEKLEQLLMAKKEVRMYPLETCPSCLVVFQKTRMHAESIIHSSPTISALS